MLSSAQVHVRQARSVLVFAALVGASSVRADDAGIGAADAGVWTPPGDNRAVEVRALIDGSLDAGVDVQALFDVPIADEEAVRVEGVRLKALLRAVDEKPSRDRAKATRSDIEGLPSEQWGARLELDRARLEFYELPRVRRDELVREHAARREALKPPETPAEARARAAEEQRVLAIEAVRVARSEAERAVGEETARLAGLEQVVLAARARIGGERDKLASRKDAILGWQRRGREARGRASPEVDSTYDTLWRALRVSRDELDGALDALEFGASEIPEVGPNPLDEFPTEFAATPARDRRASVEALVREVRAEEGLLRQDTAEVLMEEITSLNRERLGLLPDLSADKRAAIVGLTEVGFDVARAEGRHLLLILRYHRDIASRWVASLRDRGGVQGLTLWRVLGVAVPWVLLAWAFVWWRRRSPGLLALAQQRVAHVERLERRTAPSRVRRALEIGRGVHRSVEWLVFLGLLVWLLPTGASALLEVQLLNVVVGWSLAGTLVVNTINAFATSSARGRRHSSGEVERLRLRSLRLVGRVVIAFVLILFVSARLVGEGTLYSWVWSTSWLAAVLLFLILVRWWRTTVFERLDRARRKSPVQAWLLANRTGWKSFFAAMVGAVQLFVTGSYRAVRIWLAGFDVARKAHAYLFKRELDRLAGDATARRSRPIAGGVLEALSPERASGSWVPCTADEVVEGLGKRLAKGGGGVIAVVGGRGQGKSALLQRLAGSVAGALTIECDSNTSASSIRARIDERGDAPSPVLLLDDAHLVVKPVLGGLRAFDEVLALARMTNERSLWVFALDAVLWPFLRRARDSRSLFDDVIELESWTDEQIGELLTSRSTAAGFAPAFDDLLERLPASSDEVDRLEALAARRAGYFRMVWDYARGNPGIALEVWRSSLVEGVDGGVRVRSLQAPDTTQLESLPDSSLFVLRSVLQMAPVGAAEVAAATRLTEAQVQIAFRFGQAHGFLTDEGGRARVAWPWLRTVVVLLERRHLLVSS